MVFEESMNNTSLADINEMEQAVKEAFLPKAEHIHDLTTTEDVFFPEDVKLQGKVLMAEDRNYFLQSFDVSKNNFLESIEDVDTFSKVYPEGESDARKEIQFSSQNFSSQVHLNNLTS